MQDGGGEFSSKGGGKERAEIAIAGGKEGAKMVTAGGKEGAEMVTDGGDGRKAQRLGRWQEWGRDGGEGRKGQRWERRVGMAEGREG